MGKIKCLNCGTELTMISNAACPACGIRLSHVKISFLAYLGPEDSLAGYQRSYKLVLLKSIFEECLSGNTPKVRTVADRFRAYTAFAETDAAQRILEKIRNTLRSQQLDITSI